MTNKAIKILAIDDHADNLVVLKALVNDSFPDTVFIAADSGRKGFELCQAETPDVILLDIVMPGMDGYEVCNKLKADIRLRHIPVIMITANRTDKESRVRALDAGADAFITKPVDVSELKAQIKAMLRIKESEDHKKEEKQKLEDMVLDRTEALENELADRKKAENKLILSLDKITKNRQAILNLMEDLKSEINERTLVEKNLQNERNLLRTLIDNLPDTIYVFDKECRKIIANKADVKIIGCESEADALGKTDLEMYPGKSGERFYRAGMNVINTGIPKIDYEEGFIDRDGEQKFLSTSQLPLYDSGGQIIGLVGIGHDITKRKIAEQELEIKNRELSFLNTVGFELTNLTSSDNINEFIAKRLKDFSKAEVAVSLDYIPEKAAIKIKHIETSKSFLNKITKELGKRFFETEIPVPSERMKFILKEYFATSNSLNEISSGQILEIADRIIKKVTAIDHYYVIANVTGGEYFGTTLLGFREGVIAPRKEVLLSVARLAAIAIQKRKYEEKLKDSEENYRLLIENQGEGVAVVDLDESFVFANPSADEMFGVEKGGLIKRSLLDFVDTENKTIIKKETKRRSNSVKSSYEIDTIRPTGESRTILITATPQYSKEGELTGTFGVFRDITDRKLAEVALKESYEFNTSLLKSIPFGMDIVDTEGNVLFQSENFTKIFGSDAIGKKCWELYREDKKQCSDCPLFRGIVIGETESYESSGVLGGRIFDISHTGLMFQGKEAMLEIFMDITDRKQMELKIIESEAYYRTLVDISPDGIIITDLEGNVSYGSIKAHEIFGVPPGENVIGTSILRWLTPESQNSIKERFMEIIKGNIAPETREYTLKKYDDSLFWGEMSSSPLSDSEGHPISLIIVCRDISDRKEAEHELIKSKEKAEESDRLKTAFLHNISHEIRTPMNAIIGFSALLSEPDNDQESQGSYIDIISQSSNHLLSIVSDIIEISNIEAGILKLNLKTTNLNNVSGSLHNQFSTTASEKNIDLIIDTGFYDGEAQVWTDETKITQILSILLSNAFKFTVRGKITLGYKLKGNFIEFFVTDTGIGISKDQFRKIFERFYQVENTIARQYEGTGLGLSIAKAYVELLGGEIWLTSEPGSGSTFFFTIPYSSAEPALKEEKKTVIEELNKCDNMTVLIAEDEENNFRLVAELLSGLNLKIIHAGNGKEAVDICDSGDVIDLVLMDIKMPVMDGYEATSIIKKKRPLLPIIAQTAFAFESDREKVFNAGCDDYLSKPIKKDLLIAMVKKYL